MAQDSSLEVRAAALTIMKENAELTEMVAANAIYPGTLWSSPNWPFIRWGTPTVIPVRAAAVDGIDGTGAVHVFAKARYEGDKIVETAEDHVARIAAAVAKALDKKTVALETEYPANAVFKWTGTQSMADADEAEAWHAIVSFRVRVIS